MELNMHLYVYKNDETVFDSLVEQRASRMISIHPTTSKEYTEGRKFLKNYIEFNKINGDNHVGNYSKSIDLESEMFELYCSMIVDNSKYTGTGDGINDDKSEYTKCLVLYQPNKTTGRIVQGAIGGGDSMAKMLLLSLMETTVNYLIAK